MPADAGTKNLQRRRWLTAYAPLFIWIIVVLGLGSGMGAMNETSRIIRPLLEFLFPAAAPETLTIYHGYIRKFAHFAEYAVLGFLAVRAFRSYKYFLLAGFALVAAVAIIDESHQSFDPTRTGSPWDVLIDIAGGTTAIVLLKFLTSRRNRPHEPMA